MRSGGPYDAVVTVDSGEEWSALPNAPKWTSYEEVTREVVDRLARAHGVQTTRLDRNVTLKGRATANQIDVLWEFVDANAQPGRLVFECRSYAGKIRQQAMHSWRSVVDDVAVDGVATVGVMVTTIGYQSGAQDVADTYGVVTLELREPTPADTEDRVWTIEVSILPRLRRVVDFEVDAIEMLSGQEGVAVPGDDLLIEDGGGGLVQALDLLFEGETNGMREPPTPFHRVVRPFDPPRTLFVEGQPLARVRSVAAVIGEIDGEPFEFRVGGLQSVAWMLKNTLSGQRVWFAEDGRIWSTQN
jgi:hypothetical protein